MKILLDANIVGYLYRRDSRADLYRSHLEGNQHFLPFIVLAELYLWPVRRNWNEARRASFEIWLRKRFTVLPFDTALARSWAVLVGNTCRSRPISPADSWIAATAIHHGLPLVTHNRRHFENVPGLEVISEA